MQTEEYIAKSREAGLSDLQIKAKLLDAGWTSAQADSALSSGSGGLTPPPPPPASSMDVGARQEVSVVSRGYTGKGFEYFIYFISLGITAFSLGVVLHNVVDTVFGTRGYYDEAIPVALAALIVVAPIAVFFFLHTKKNELKNPAILADPTRAKATQTLLTITFLIGISKLVRYVYSLIGGDSGYGVASSPVGDLFHALITIGIAGGLFIYYFRDHRKNS